LIWEIPHETRYFQPLSRTLPQEFERYNLQAMLNGVGDFAGVGSRNFRHGVCLSNDKEVLVFSDIIFRLASVAVSAEKLVKVTIANYGALTNLITRKSVG